MANLQNPIPFNPQTMTVSELLEAAETLKTIYSIAISAAEHPAAIRGDVGTHLEGHVMQCLEHANRKMKR